MTMTRRQIGATVALVGLAAATGSRPPTGLAPAQDDAGVRLEYKWKLGQVLRYRMTTSGTITTKMEGFPGGGAPIGAGGFPMEMEMTMEMHQRIKEVGADGTATVAQQLKSMNMTNKVMGQQMAMKFEGGKFSMLMNGQPMALPPGQAANPGEAMGQTFDMKISRRGQVIGLEGAAREALAKMFQGAQVSQVFGAGTLGAGMLMLPETPIKVGGNWEDKQLVRMPAPGPPGGAGGAPIEANFQVRNTLSKIEPGTGGAGRLAVIATRAQTTLPEMKVAAPEKAAPEGGFAMTMRDFKQTVDGTVRFDPDAGVVRGGDYKVGLAMKMDMPFGAPPGAGGGGAAKPGMSISGDLKMKVALLEEGAGNKTATPSEQ